jgi:hypothetical protein
MDIKDAAIIDLKETVKYHIPGDKAKEIIESIELYVKYETGKKLIRIREVITDFKELINYHIPDSHPDYDIAMDAITVLKVYIEKSKVVK